MDICKTRTLATNSIIKSIINCNVKLYFNSMTSKEELISKIILQRNFDTYIMRKIVKVFDYIYDDKTCYDFKIFDVLLIEYCKIPICALINLEIKNYSGYSIVIES